MAGSIEAPIYGIVIYAVVALLSLLTLAVMFSKLLRIKQYWHLLTSHSIENEIVGEAVRFDPHSYTGGCRVSLLNLLHNRCRSTPVINSFDHLDPLPRRYHPMPGILCR